MKFSAAQVSRLAFVYMVSEPLVFFVGRLLKLSNYQGWLTLLGAFMLSTILLHFTVKLGEVDPGSSWVDFGNRIMGKGIHNIFIVLILLLSIYLISLDITNFSTFIGSMYLIETPIWVVMSLTALCITLTARTGLESIIYMAEGIFLITLISTLLTSPMMVSSANPEMLMALITHHNFKKAALDSIPSSAWFTEWIFFLFIAPFVTFQRKLFRRLFWSLGLIITFIFLYWLICLLNFGPYLGSQVRYPILEVIRIAKYGDFLDNLDPFLIAFWSSTMFIRSSFLLYVASVCLTKLAGLSERRSVVFILGGAAGVFAMQYSAHTTAYEVITRSYAVITFVLLIELIPLYYLLIRRIRFGKIRVKK